MVGPEGALMVDWFRKAPGRGAHLCYSSSCLDGLSQGGGLSRALKRSVETPDTELLRRAILDSIEGRIGNLLSIGRTAGWAVSGTDVLLRAASKVRLLILAEDVAADSERKLRAAMGGQETAFVVYRDAAFLGQTQGKEARVALGIVEPQMAQRLKIEFERRDCLLVAA